MGQTIPKEQKAKLREDEEIRKKTLVPKLEVVSPEVIDERIYVVEEMPILKESLNKDKITKQKESKRILYVRDRTHWHGKFVSQC